MSNKDKRYVVQIDMYLYAENDYMARKRANDIPYHMLHLRHSQDVNVKEIGEQPFSSMEYRKLDDPTFTPKDKSNEPLPF